MRGRSVNGARLANALRFVCLLGIAAPALASALQAAVVESQDGRREVFRAMLWGGADEAREARDRWRQIRATAGRGADDADPREEVFDLEEVLREGPSLEGTVTGAVDERISVFLPDRRVVPVFVVTPPGYSPERAWPLMFAMHGGPPGSEDAALRSAVGMVEVWRQPAAASGWIIASPAMLHVRSMGPRTEDRLPYEILTPEQVETILAALQHRYRIDPDRIASTGISLGSNFSIGYGASMPHRFAAIVPVSTEGDSREHLLRNLQHVPTYVLEGAQDRNIRGINGPRALAEILARFAYDATYREFSERAHEGFSELYPDVLRWLAVRPRDAYPRDVLRLPHSGIMPLSRRVFWIESDTRQGVVRVRVLDDNHIEIESRWARSVTLYLNDRIVDLDRPVEVTINGVSLEPRRLVRSVAYAVDEVRRLDDAGRVATAGMTIAVPSTPEVVSAGEAFWSSLSPVHPEGQLSFWEYYAVNALAERFPTVGFTGREVELGADVRAALSSGGLSTGDESVGIEITAVDADSPFAGSVRPGDLLIEAGGEPFFRGRGDVDVLHDWLMRELRATAHDYQVVVWRDEELVRTSRSLALGDYQSQ